MRDRLVISRKGIRKIAVCLIFTLLFSLISERAVLDEIKNAFSNRFVTLLQKEELTELKDLQSKVMENVSLSKQAVLEDDINEAGEYLSNISTDLKENKDSVLRELKSVEKQYDNEDSIKEVKDSFQYLIDNTDKIEEAADSRDKELIEEVLQDESLFGNNDDEHEVLGNTLPHSEKVYDKHTEEVYSAEKYRAIEYPIENEIEDYSEYIKETDDTKITNEIRNKADELGENPLDLYKFVRNNIHFEPYYGSRKGAEGTLEQYTGNDFDQSSLLISLLRAKNIPARYVIGHVNISAENAMKWTGTSNIDAAIKILACLGNDVTSLYVDGEIGKVRVKHVWVEAYCNMKEYRGTGKDGEKKGWIPFDPSFKRSTRVEGIDITKEAGIDLDDFSGFPITAEKTEDGFGYKKAASDGIMSSFEEINDYIEGSLDEEKINKMSGAEIFGGLKIEPENIEVFQYSIPNELESIEKRTSEIDDTDRDYINISLKDRFGREGGIDYRISSVNAYGKKIILRWVPAEEKDKDIVKKYGSMYKTPAYLIHVKPVLEIDDEVVEEGSSSEFGGRVEAHITLHHSGTDDQNIVNTLYSGGYYLVGLDYGIIAPKELQNIQGKLGVLQNQIGDVREFFESDKAGNILNAELKLYFSEVDAMNRIIAEKYKIRDVRQLSCGMTGFSPKISYLITRPVSVKLSDMYIDIDADSHAPISMNNNPVESKEYTILSGYISSALEHSIFNQLAGRKAVSTVEVISECSSQDIPIYNVNKDNIDKVMPLLKVDNAVKREIKNSVNSGANVIVPERNIKYENWRGTGYVVQDDVSGSTAYMISGGHAGGSVIEDMSGLFLNGDFVKGFFEGLMNGLVEGLAIALISAFVLGLITTSCTAMLIIGAVLGIAALIYDVIEISDILKAYASGGMDPGEAGYMVGQIIGEFVGGLFGALKGGKLSGSQCFPKGTVVKAENGDIPIEKINVGDKVYTLNNDKTELKPVTRIFKNRAKTFAKITAVSAVITATLSHPFYVQGIGYTNAANLTEGEKLVTYDGCETEIKNVDIISLDEEEDVYNFEVGDFHNYFVDYEGILVHNYCVRSPKSNVNSKDPLPDGGTRYNLKTTNGDNVTVDYDKNGYPDFEPYTLKGPDGRSNYDITCSNNREADFRAANKEAGYPSKPDGYTWHHSHYGYTDAKGNNHIYMQLVKTDVHKAAQHTGGFSMNKNGIPLYPSK